MDIKSTCLQLRRGAAILALQTADQKNAALSSVCTSLDVHRGDILESNEKDIAAARTSGMTEALIERLLLNQKRIDDIIHGIQEVISQADPIGEETAGWKTPNGLSIHQVRVPLGVAAIIYESRPNVTADAFCLAYKSGNAILLRGSSSALNSNKAIASAIKEGLCSVKDGVPDAVELVESTDHSDVDQILNAVGLIDVVLPRGGANLIKAVTEKAKVPVILKTGSGVCHLFVDSSADINMAARIAENAKIQRPGACNAIETIVVHKDIVSSFLPVLEKQLAGRVQLRADKTCYPILKTAAGSDKEAQCIISASEEDFGYEFLDFICAVKAVSSIEEAIGFINSHNTKHSESIITNDRMHARMFQAQIDAACVYVNASTRFTDGGQFGFGVELGISTQKLHARGPMGIKALTTTKFLIDGEGQTR